MSLRYNKPNKPQGLNTYIKGWKYIRKGILDRDNYACRICGDDGEGVSLHVHHIDSIRSNNDSKNLVTLCRGCHQAVHAENYMPCDHEDYPCPWGAVE